MFEKYDTLIKVLEPYVAKVEIPSILIRREGNVFLLLIQGFVDYVRHYLGLAEETAKKYEESMLWVARDLPYIQSPDQITLQDIITLKKRIRERPGRKGKTNGESRVNSIIFALRKFLAYCQKIHKFDTINPKEINPMKVPKKEVIYLSKEEIVQLLSSINFHSRYGLRMRALMELLIASGMRISEALSLNRDSLDLKNLEAKIIGKGNKPRTVYFTERAAEWVKKYLSGRDDESPDLFVAFGTGKRLTRHDLGKLFRAYAKRAGLKTKVTPHILRHSMATLILHNGGNIKDIQDLLGHTDIKTTAKYYLGTDKKKLKESHDKFLRFD